MEEKPQEEEKKSQAEEVKPQEEEEKSQVEVVKQQEEEKTKTKKIIVESESFMDSDLENEEVKEERSTGITN